MVPRVDDPGFLRSRACAAPWWPDDHEGLSPDKRLHAARPFQGLRPGFAGDAHGGHRTGYEALFADLAAAEVAVTIGAGVDPVQGFPDLTDQSPFPVADPQGEVPFRLQGGPCLLYTS